MSTSKKILIVLTVVLTVFTSNIVSARGWDGDRQDCECSHSDGGECHCHGDCGDDECECED